MFKMSSIVLMVCMELTFFYSTRSLDMEKLGFEQESLEALANKLLKNGRMVFNFIKLGRLLRLRRIRRFG